MAIEKVIDIQIQSNSEQAVGSLRSQLKQAQADVASLSEKFGATSMEAIEAAKKAGELKDKIGDAKALTDAFNPDAKFKALSSSLAGVAGGFAAVQGGMALFGQQSEDVEKTLLKVQSAMALSQGLQSVGESVDSFKQLGAVIKSASVVQSIYNFIQTGSIGLTKANATALEEEAVAKNISTAATASASTGLKLFRLALIGTGIGALIVGVGLLIANFDKVKKVVLNLIPGLAEVGEFIGGIVDSITDFVGATSDATRALDKLKENAEKTLAVNKKFMQEHGDQVDEYTKKKIDAKNAYAEAVKEDGANEAELAKRLNRELAAIEYSRGDEKRKIQKAAKEKAIAEDKSQKEKEKKQREDDDKKYLEETKNGLQILNQAVLDNEAQKKSDQLALKDEQLALLEEGIAEITEIEDQAAADKKAKEDKIAADKKAADEKDIEFQKNKDSVIAASKQNLNNIIAGLEASGLNKSKAGQAISKAIALTQIGIDSAVAISKASTLANAEGVAAQLAFPLVPGIGTIARVVSYASTAATVIGNIARAKQLLSGGGGGGSSAPSGGGGSSTVSGGASTPPSFNVVGAAGTNQLAQSIGQQQQQPIQAYVVANNITTAQSLQRNIIESATIGG